ncbi:MULTISPECIES: patatin-like phospholipase family protein [Filomicrobium]|uniref:NTE family protein n=1 Tax=Filomicrobium insigne TaxID=418854 RepID=A0A1H0LKR4_9HYPH|nr:MULTISPECIES: patatin-like phospholipase family protein [Filomicrobium]SDO68685.1 NTE family protein [Filomicrobium insigne]
MRIFKNQLTINLALQGGGAHGAFTWGVLDRLLEEENIEIGWVSATSAGAVNAVALAGGLVNGGRVAARAKLHEVWESVYKSGVPDLLRMNPFLYSLSRSPALTQVASLWSPYDFNPLGFDPLRRILTDAIDFDALRDGSPIQLLIAATEIATGRARLFRNHELTIESVLASACLPTIHHAVEIDGKAYWDGGFSANPDIVTLAGESPVNDTLIVQLNPTAKSGLPTGVREIADHANRLTFNAPLIRDVEIIETAREAVGHFGRFGLRGRLARLVKHRFHHIEAGRYTSSLSPESKIKPDWETFMYLQRAGRLEASKWLDRHRADVGVKSTVDLKARFLDARDEAATQGGEAGEAQPRDRIAG